MSTGYIVKDLLLRGAEVTVANATTVVSSEFNPGAEGSLNLLVKVVADTVTAGSGVTAKLQESYDGGNTWEDVGNRAEVSVTGDGAFEISLISTDTSDAAQLPLWPKCRVAVTAASDATATVTHVYVALRV